MAEIKRLPQQRKPLVDYALQYAERGMRVFALRGKFPAQSNRQWEKRLGRPIEKGGFHMATTDEETIRWMFSAPGVDGIGLPTGEVNQCIVLDLDLKHEPKKDGNAHAVMAEFEDEISCTQIVHTPSGGLHAYFDFEEGHAQRELGRNIEVQGTGQYVAVPPSRGYQWGPRVDREDWPMPCWEPSQQRLREEVREDRAEVPAHIKEMARMLREREHWHSPARDIVAYLVGCGWSDAEILKFTLQWTWDGYDPRDTFETISTMITGARRKGWGAELPKRGRTE